MPELLVRSALSRNLETKLLQQARNLLRLQDWRFWHRLGNDNLLGTDKVGFERRLPVFKQHGDDFSEVFAQFVQGFALGMRAWKPGNVSNEQTRVRAMLND